MFHGTGHATRWARSFLVRLYHSALPPYSSSCCAASRVTTDKSSRVVTSPVTELEVTISRSSRRMILRCGSWGANR